MSPKRKLESGWKLCDRAEGILQSFELKFRIVVVTNEKIDWVASDENVGRLSRLNSQSDDKIQDFAEAMEDGDLFPLPILTKGKDGYVICAGYHRTKAWMLLRQDVPLSAYCVSQVISCDQIEEIAVQSNIKEGDRMFPEVRLEKAMSRVLRGESLGRAAKVYGVKESTLSGRVQAAELRRKAVEEGYPGVSNVKDYVLRLLAVFKDNIKVFSAACECVTLYSGTQDERSSFVKGIKACPTETKKLEFISGRLESLREEDRQRGRSTRTPSERYIIANFKRNLNGLNSVLDKNPSLSLLQIQENSDEHQEILRGIDKLTANIKKVFGPSHA